MKTTPRTTRLRHRFGVLAVLLPALALLATARALAVIEWEAGAEKGGMRQPIWLEPFTISGDTGRLDPMSKAGENILLDDLLLSGHFRVDGPVAADLGPRDVWVARSKGPDLTAVVIGRLESGPEGVRFVGRVLAHPSEKLIFERQYPVAKEIRPVMHAFCDDIVLHLTGEAGIARTRIACICAASKSREVLVVDYDGHGPKLVTKDNSANLAPAWSPVDPMIAYTSFKRGEADLYAVNPETGQTFDVSHYPGIDSAPAWSPDGRLLAVTLAIKSNPDIYLIRRNGEIVERLTFDPAIDTSPCFSPTGRQIAFTSSRLGSPQLFIMDSDGLNVTRLPIPHTYTDSPAWSPRAEGTGRIAYAARLGAAFDIFVTTPDGGSVTQLTFGQGSNENPRWAPDGRHIVFSSTRGGKRGIYVMLADGSNQRRLTPADRDCFYPTWSPRPAGK